MIDQLKTDIARLEAELKLKKLMEKELRKANRKEFFETKPGQGLMRFCKTVTRPFAEWHQEATLAIESPADYKASLFTKDAARILKECQSVDPDHKDARSLAMSAAEKVIQLESLNSTDTALSTLISSLDEQVQRLRGPKNQDKAQQIFNMLLQNPEVIDVK